MSKKLRIAFLHKALLFGGAERLILDMALAFKEQSHEVSIYTAEYDKEKTFTDFQTSGVEIRKVCSFLPPRIKGKFHALMNYVRMLFITLYFVFSFRKFDLVVVDQITLPIPILRLFRKKVLYYCHFPEALLNDNKRTFIVIIYRFVVDLIESFCLYFATLICFNSQYTQTNVEQTFKAIKKWKGKKYVVYPCMQNPAMILPKIPNAEDFPKDGFLLSLNRFETRKRIDIAVEAFAKAISKSDKVKKSGLKLVLAGGLDKKNQDALNCREALGKQAEQLGIKDRVVFRENISQEEKEVLLT